MSRWKPKKGEEYYFVDIIIFGVNYYYWRDDGFDRNRYKSGNCFKTKEEAVKALERVKELLLSLQDNDNSLRDKLISLLTIHVYTNVCEGIKTETLKKINELIENDLDDSLQEGEK